MEISKRYFTKNKIPRIMNVQGGKFMKERKIDLHIHTIYSDGEYTPEEVFAKVKEKGLEVFSITDHDTIEGAKKMTSKEGILYIPGVELTAKCPIGREHILGYNLDLKNTTLNQVLNAKKQSDRDNFLLYYQTLQKKYGITFPKEEIDFILNRVGNVGRVDLSNLIRKYGYASTQEDAFQKYLNPINEAVRFSKKGLTEEECIRLLKEAGGYVSLAHPISLNPNYRKQDLKVTYQELKSRLLLMKSYGLDAIEIEHIHQDIPFREMLKELANELSLLESGGTDFHGEKIKSGVEIGSGYQGNVAIKQLSLVDKIRQS